MSDPTITTAKLQECLDRWRAGDRAAADELLRTVLTRLERLAARMLQGFPNVRGLADTDDVLQNSVMRLLRTLRSIRPATTRDFFNLAAVHIRRELLDLARRAQGKEMISLNLGSSDPGRPAEPAAPQLPETDYWVRFHLAVDQLPVEEREVVSLTFYHGWTQVRIAELFHLDERTIRRRWSNACIRIRKAVGTEWENES